MNLAPDIDEGLNNELPVYLGVWVNWSRGRIMGATVTMERASADLLIAFTAFFIAFVSTRFWRIMCFLFHRVYSTSTHQDSIYHQRQAILRNVSTPEDGIRLLLMLLWGSFKSQAHNRFRPLPAAIGAALCLGAFAVAGGFSSLTSTAVGHEVLIKTRNCGYPNATLYAEDMELWFAAAPSRATRISNAANYAQQCYSSDNAGLLDCRRFVTKHLPSTIDENATCPFGSGICRTSENNLQLDTGYVDSSSDLGLNTPAYQKILIRNVLHCAPLKTTGFTSQHGDTTLYHYGGFQSSTGYVDYMYAARSVDSQYPSAEVKETTTYANYHLNACPAAMMNGTVFIKSSCFTPIGPIVRTDIDVTIFFLSGNGVLFLEPAIDEWYRADSVYNMTDTAGNKTYTRVYYRPTEAASPLACANQYQFCNGALPGESGCGSLASLRDAIADAAPLFNTSYIPTFKEPDNADTEAVALFKYVANIILRFNGRIEDILLQLGPAALQSQRTLLNSDQGPIAPNQWQLDVKYWWDISHAAMQSAFINAAYGPSDPSILQSWANFTSPNVARLCANQKVQSEVYTSFSLFGLYFTFTTGCLIALASYLLEPVAQCLHKRKGHNRYHFLEWATNGTLQLQRLAQEEIGCGTWSKGTDTIPRADRNDLLAPLDITNLDHPVLRRLSEDGGPFHTAQGSSEGLEDVTTTTSETQANSALDPAPIHQENSGSTTTNTPLKVEDAVPERAPDPSASSVTPLEGSEALVTGLGTAEQEQDGPGKATACD